MIRDAIWTDPDAIEGLATVGRVGFLVEVYRPGAGSVWELRNNPIAGRAGGEILTGPGQARDNRHYTAHGLGRVARHAKTSGRVCLAPVIATAELLDELGHPALAPEPPAMAMAMATLAQPVDDDDIRRPREVQLLLEQLAVVGLTLAPLRAPTEQEQRQITRALDVARDVVRIDVRAARRWWDGRKDREPSNSALRRAVGIAGSFHVALSELAAPQIVVGMRVYHPADGGDTGIVDSIAESMAEVRWDSGVTTSAPIDELEAQS